MANSDDAMIIERTTRQRSAIRDVIESCERPLPPQEILDPARRAVVGLGLATVYRNLKLLLAQGAIAAVAVTGDSPRYDLRRLAPRGFRVEHHEVTLYGRCSDCGGREARSAR